MFRFRAARFIALLALVAHTSACSLGQDLELRSSSTFASSLNKEGVLRTVSSRGSGKISHVIIIVQENRSLDNLFHGYPGADTVARGFDSKGHVIQLRPVSLATKYTIDHSSAAMFAACNGRGETPGTRCRMNGFDLENNEGAPVNLKYPEYVYVPRSEARPYFEMAYEGALADRMFQSQIDESFTAHQYLIAAQAGASVNLPIGLWGCNGGAADTVETITQERAYGQSQRACFDYKTLGDELDEARLSWHFYTSKLGAQASGNGSVWSAYEAVRHIRYGPDWNKDVVTPQTRFITDVAAGKLSNVTWITPICVNSDHVNCGGGFGPSWVAALVNAVGESKFWNNSTIFVLWDDWGGLYDHVPPPYHDYDGLGFRVPLLMISPYVRQHYVSHTQYETASVLRFTEDLFGLRQMAASDERAISPAYDSFDFTKAPRKFTPIKAPLGRSFFLRQYNDGRPPDYE